MSTRQTTTLAVGLLWLAAGVVLGAPVLWLAAGAPLLAAAVAGMRAPGRIDDEHELRRRLAVARRRGEHVDVLCAEAVGVAPGDVRGALRISDFTAVRPGRGRVVDLRAVVDADGLDRAALETRLHRTLGGRWTFSWARFPEDGATFDALVQQARARAATSLTTSDQGGN
jgi:hypothetical protein